MRDWRTLYSTFGANGTTTVGIVRKRSVGCLCDEGAFSGCAQCSVARFERGFSLNTFSFFSVTPLHVSFQSLINWAMCSSFDCNLFYSRRLGSQILTPLLACCGLAITFALSCTVDMMSPRVDAFTISERCEHWILQCRWGRILKYFQSEYWNIPSEYWSIPSEYWSIK